MPDMAAYPADGGADAEFDDVVSWAATAPLPPEVARKARLLLLDSLGCVLSGLRHGEVAATAAAMSSLCSIGQMRSSLAWTNSSGVRIRGPSRAVESAS